MKLRSATINHNSITAECPVGEDCQAIQITQGKMMTFSCPHYHGLYNGDRGQMVRCNYSAIACNC
ncbi:hypothetical protein JYT85_01450 [Desulfocapsa sp. AH-315-G09]|uniref:Uncharacterized protein n=1 Tax=Desulfotalea psychrophila TaxID=84980 RepID=A0ABS3ATY0_9BACT|nr:hypothetical protein [Desulfocapsa sp.]MBN4065292.1 hypothetical protein [Desulfocapsa sp. AH-315-G09]MBN4068422.1 hypothetical protein [Desulfotalea psychrophila]